MAERKQSRRVWRRLSDVPERAVDWLWRGRIPAGELSLLEGQGGLGKSTIAADLAARVTTGQAMPGEDDERPPRGVVWLGSEDSLDAVIRPRLRGAGADLSRVFVRDLDADRWTTATGADELEALVREHGVALVVLDALKDHTRGDDHGERDVRDALRPLVDLAHRTGAAVIGLRHWTKSARAASARGAGSTGYRDVARSVLQLGKRPDGEGLALAHDKANLSRLAPTIAVALEGDGDFAAVAWGELLEVSADDLALHDPSSPRSSRAAAASTQDATKRAAEALREVLAAGPMLSSDAKSRVTDELGCGERTVERASQLLGVVAGRTGFGRPSRWRLPGTGSSAAVPAVAPTPDSPAARRDGETGGTGRNPPCEPDLAVPPSSERGATVQTAIAGPDAAESALVARPDGVPREVIATEMRGGRWVGLDDHGVEVRLHVRVIDLLRARDLLGRPLA